MKSLVESISALVIIAVVLVVIVALARLVLDNIWYIGAVLVAIVAAGYLYSQTKR